MGRHAPALPEDVEKELHDHIKRMEQSLYGLTVLDVQQVAFDLAEPLRSESSLQQDEKACRQGLAAWFFKRYGDLSVRTPQETNLSRAVGLNRPKVQQFFALYKDLLQKHQYQPSQIWNMDKSGISTVHVPGKIVASKGARQVSKITSGQRGRTVMVICSMSAAGTFLPPMLIYPRKRMVDTLMSGTVGGVAQWLGCRSVAGGLSLICA